MGGPPPGWLDDPDEPGRERWWDGSGWTEHRRRTTHDSAARPPGGAATLTGPRSDATSGTLGSLNAMAVASLVASLVWMFGLASVVAIVLGVRARREIASSGGAQRGDGLAVAGIALGVLGVIGVIVPLVLALTLGVTRSVTSTEAVQDVMVLEEHARTDDPAEHALRVLHERQQAFHADHGRYARLSELDRDGVDPELVIRGDVEEDAFCIEVLPAGGGGPMSTTHEDATPRARPC